MVRLAGAVVVVVGVKHDREHDLLLVVQVLSLLRRRLGLSDNRKENGGKNRDDRDDDEQFNERKRSSFHRVTGYP